MSIIKYVARRNLLTGDASVSGTDISTDDVSNQFRSVTTDLSGFTDGNFVFVSGVVTYANPDLINGWHAVTANSTTNAITVQSDLPTSAVGDQITIDEYVHRLNLQYVLDMSLTGLDPTRDSDVEEAVSYGGLRQGLLYRIDRGYSVTVLVHDDDLKSWQEFFESVSGREPFLMDPFGTEAAPVEPKLYTLDGDERYARIGNFKVVRKWKITFKAVEA